ncbi:MAG: DUF2191 domain-containing protein [Candidatus Margulisbacteria bacterium]|jgi:hypothetical protein|nr:DUF2191 domain-containing protein [Candidatus Margulisiibacteriota bacterium]
MKVTAIISDQLINEVKNYSHSSTTTEAITIALQDWLAIYRLKALNKQLLKKPLRLKSAQKIRKLNRRRP